MTKSMVDMSVPYSGVPHADVTGFYIGGDTPHIWTTREVNAITTTYRLPIWVRSNPGSYNGILEANSAVAWLLQHGVPKGCALALDFETAVDNDYVHLFDTVTGDAGYKTVLYGSLSTIEQNPTPRGGFWVADWNNKDVLVPGSVATQYESFSDYDLSIVSDSLELWSINPPVNSTPPTTSQNGTDDMLTYLMLNSGLSYLPVPYAGSSQASTVNVRLTAQSQGNVAVWWGRNNAWIELNNQVVGFGGSYHYDVPTDSSVDLFKILSDVPLTASVFVK
jgi:hypothetical protein